MTKRLKYYQSIEYKGYIITKLHGSYAVKAGDYSIHYGHYWNMATAKRIIGLKHKVVA